MKLEKGVGLAYLTLMLATASGASAQTSPEGLWIDHTGRGGVEIRRCGEALCGHIAWLKDKANSKLCGTKIIGNLKPVGRGKWDNGWIYSPEKGERYDVELTPLKSGKLRVLGYAGVKFLSETMIWKPAPADLERCDNTRSAKLSPDNATPKPDPQPEARAPAVNQPEISNPDAVSPGSPAAKPDKQTTEDRKPIEVPKTGTETYGKVERKAELDPPVAQQAPVERDADEAPSRRAKGPFTRRKDTCKLDLPYITLSFPCPD